MAHPNRPASPPGLPRRAPGARSLANFATRLGGLAVACAAGAVLLLLALAVAERGGVPSSIAMTVFAAGAAAILGLIALVWPALRLRRFLAADNMLPPVANGSAGALGAMPCGAALAGGALVLAAGLPGLAALGAGFCGAAILGAALRRTEAVSPVEYLGLRCGRAVRGVAAATSFAVCLALALSAMLAVTTVASRGLGLAPETASALAAAAALLAVLPGGVLSLTAFAGAGLVLPVLGSVLALVFGAKLTGTDASLWLAPLQAVLAPEDARVLMQGVPALFAVPAGGKLATLAVLAAGLASAPHLLLRAAASESRPAALNTLGHVLIFTVFLALCGAASGVIAALYLDAAVIDRTLGGLAPAVRDLVDAGLLRLCGASAWDAARAACGTRALVPTDVALDPSLALIGLPRLAGLPGGFSGLVLIGVAADLTAGLAACLLVATSAGTYELLNTFLRTSLGEGRVLVFMRLALIVLAAVIVRLAASDSLDPWALAMTGLALSAAVLFPALVLSSVPLVGPRGVLVGMVAGLGVALAWLALFGTAGAAGAGLAGLVAGFTGGLAARTARLVILGDRGAADASDR